MTFTATPLKLPGAMLLTSRRHRDERGAFTETFRESALVELGVREKWVQDNQVFSRRRGTLRGLHFQRPPHAQAKLVRVLRGAIVDVIVDLRGQSVMYGQHEIIELDAGDDRQVYVPAGFAHGYCTLRDDTEVVYKTSAEYALQTEGGLRWDDRTLAIAWPNLEIEVAPRDGAWPDFAAFVTPF